MAMDKINGSHLLPQGILDGSRQSERTSKDGRPDSVRTDTAPAAGRSGAGDTAEISPTAHLLMDLRHAVESGRRAMTALPDIRQDKVELARERLESGFYDSETVRETVAAGVESAILGLENL